MSLSKIRLLNLALCLLGAAVIAAYAARISWASGMFAAWAALPVLIVFPVAVVSAKMPQQLACLFVTTLSFLFGLLNVHQIMHSSDAFTPLAAWAMPAVHIFGAFFMLVVATGAATFLKVRVREA